MFKEQLGKRIRKIRQEQGISQDSLSKSSGLSRRFLGQIEQGEANASFEKLLEIAEALNVSLTTLFTGIGPVQDSLDIITQQFSSLSAEHLKKILTGLADKSRKFALIGLRGCGKSTIGKAVAEQINLPFIQTDQVLKQKTNMSLHDIFHYYGPEQYRELSRNILQDILENQEPIIIETGGSLIMDPICFSMLKQKTTLIWLTASPEDHVQRVHLQGDERIFDQAQNYIKTIKSILEQRSDFYEQANHIIDTSRLGLEASISLVIRVIQENNKQPSLPLFPLHN